VVREPGVRRRTSSQAERKGPRIAKGQSELPAWADVKEEIQVAPLEPHNGCFVVTWLHHLVSMCLCVNWAVGAPAEVTAELSLGTVTKKHTGHQPVAHDT
jgi:hypothetical protein